MMIDAQSTSGFEGITTFPDWSFPSPPKSVIEENPQIVGNNNSNVISITGSV